MILLPSWAAPWGGNFFVKIYFTKIFFTFYNTNYNFQMPTGGYGPQPTSDYNNYGGGEPCEVSTTTLFQIFRFLLYLHF